MKKMLFHGKATSNSAAGLFGRFISKMFKPVFYIKKENEVLTNLRKFSVRKKLEHRNKDRVCIFPHSEKVR
jgi:hypothetical protein